MCTLHITQIILFWLFILFPFSSSASNAIAYFFCIFRRNVSISCVCIVCACTSILCWNVRFVWSTEQFSFFQLKCFEWIRAVKYVNCNWTPAKWDTQTQKQTSQESENGLCSVIDVIFADDKRFFERKRRHTVEKSDSLFVKNRRNPRLWHLRNQPTLVLSWF